MHQVSQQHYLQLDKTLRESAVIREIVGFLFTDSCYAHEFKASEVAGFDVHIRAYWARMEYDTKKLLSSLPEAEMERKGAKP